MCNAIQRWESELRSSLSTERRIGKEKQSHSRVFESSHEKQVLQENDSLADQSERVRRELQTQTNLSTERSGIGSLK